MSRLIRLRILRLFPELWVIGAGIGTNRGSALRAGVAVLGSWVLRFRRFYVLGGMRLLWTLGLALPALASAALHFDGGQKLRVENCPALQISSDITVEAWVKPDSDAARIYFTYILSKNYDNTGFGLLTVGREKKVVEATGWPYGLHSDVTVEAGKWTHLAFVRSSRKCVVYVNGREVGSRVDSGTLKTSEFPLYLGGSSFLNNQEGCNWIGGLKEVRIWKVARSGRNIRRTMNSRLSPRHMGLAAYFPMNEGKGNVVRDRTGHTGAARIPEGGPVWVADR